MNFMPTTGPKGVIVHHSAGNDGPAVNVQEIKRIHVQERGWEDIGYHFLIDEVNGIPQIYCGRNLEFEGAHCPGKNDYVGVCVIGNFSKSEPSAAKLEKLSSLLKGLMFWYKLTPEQIHKHSDFKATACPGEKFPWKSIKNRIEAFHQTCKGYF